MTFDPKNLKVGVDVASGPDWSSAMICMSQETWANYRNSYADLKADYYHMLDDLRTMTADRDGWHHAYDKLVSDVVHGRKHTVSVKLPVDPADLQAQQDADTFGLGVVHEAADGTRTCIDPRDFLRGASDDVKPERLVPRGPFPPKPDPEGSAMGYAATDEKPKPSVEELLAHFERYVFGD